MRGEKSRRRRLILRQHFVQPGTQRGLRNLDHTQPVVDVFDELDSLHSRVKVSVRRGNHSNVGV
jgi:hypothetical protein